MAALQHPHHPPYRALAINHRVAGALTNPLEHRVDAHIVERSRQHANRLETKWVRNGVEFPEPEMPGDEQHALALRVRETHAVLAIELDARQHLGGGQG